MKLLYLYIEDYGCIKDQEFNFDSNYRFHLDRSNPQEWQLIEEKVENPLPDDFWASSDGKHNVVESVSAIIGENGSGKTTLARILGNTNLFRNIDCKFILVFIKSKDSTLQYISNIKKQNINFNVTYSPDNYLPYIYFSPIFTTEHVFYSSSCVDISTSSLLSNIKNEDEITQTTIGKYKSEEYKRVLNFLSEYYHKKRTHIIPMTLPEPKGIQISLREMNLLKFTNNLGINDEEWNELNKKNL